MPEIYELLPDTIEEVDIIIAGGRHTVPKNSSLSNLLLLGGTSGCVVASRLAEADPNLSILVIEGGPNNLDVPTIVHPALCLSALLPTSNATIFYKGNKESQLNDRELVVPSGGTLGGGSSINLMMYSRAQRCDFDLWNVPGWATEDMLPYMKKVREEINHTKIRY